MPPLVSRSLLWKTPFFNLQGVMDPCSSSPWPLKFRFRFSCGPFSCALNLSGMCIDPVVNCFWGDAGFWEPTTFPSPVRSISGDFFGVSQSGITATFCDCDFFKNNSLVLLNCCLISNNLLGETLKFSALAGALYPVTIVGCGSLWVFNK